MVRLFSILSLISLISFSTSSFAQKTFTTKSTSVCGGEIRVSDDCANNKHRYWHVSCCDENYRVQGITYSDHRNSDSVDTVGTVCRSVSKGNKELENRDFGTENKTKLVCKRTEVLTGVQWKDRINSRGKDIDSMDSIVPICTDPSDGSSRTLSTTDADNGGKTYKESASLKYEVVGIATRERLSDTTECASLIVAPRAKK